MTAALAASTYCAWVWSGKSWLKGTGPVPAAPSARASPPSASPWMMSRTDSPAAMDGNLSSTCVPSWYTYGLFSVSGTDLYMLKDACLLYTYILIYIDTLYIHAIYTCYMHAFIISIYIYIYTCMLVIYTRHAYAYCIHSCFVNMLPLHVCFFLPCNRGCLIDRSCNAAEDGQALQWSGHAFSAQTGPLLRSALYDANRCKPCNIPVDHTCWLALNFLHELAACSLQRCGA